MITMMTVTSVPRKAMIVRARMMKGSEAVKSMPQLTASSTMPPKRAARKPSSVPMTSPRSVPTTASTKDMRIE